MPQIIPLPLHRAAEARLVIYEVAHQLFHSDRTFAETLQAYREEWPLHDLDDPQRSYFDHGGTFLVVVDGQKIIGTGGLRQMADPTAGEIKRLWLLPAYQGQGLGYRVMQALLAEARTRGYTCVRLCTSPKYQQRAYAFYTRLGFYEIPRYNDDPDDISMELRLSG